MLRKTKIIVIAESASVQQCAGAVFYVFGDMLDFPKMGYPNKTAKKGAKKCMIKWVYWGKLYETKFQAGCLVRRMENDWWVYGYECPQEIEVFRSRKGRFGVRFLP
ncbi:hypothetical protein A8990_10223 [Paenibacillus taihuensis]|uniref:Uncharacterized protein n=2 Tax=Paenibacillus taihuensis TaxID=1156355 RepID=A0A3D9SI30_9BACL|nr:hypothetical protein A8990_10223 [Paenibacillus taihuensis]